MKILILGDFHGKFPTKLKRIAKSKDIDSIICLGDYGGGKNLIKIIFKYFKQKWWKVVGKEKAKKYILEDYNAGKKIFRELSKLNKPVYCIFGNWDFNSLLHKERFGNLKLKNYHEIIKQMKNLKYWRRGLREFNGLRIIIFDKMVTAGDYLKKGVLSDKERKKMIRKNKKEIKSLMQYGRRDIDLFLSHYPPYGFFDIVKFKGKNPMNGKHVGFRGFTDFIKKYHPKLFICGHMHEYQGIKNLGNSTIVATGAAQSGRAVILDVSKDKKIRINLIK